MEEGAKGQVVTSAKEAVPTQPSRRGRKLLSGCLVLVLAAAFGAGYMLWTLKQVPEFYQQAAAQVADPAAREVAAVQFEQKLEELRLDAEESSEWSETFSQNQINSWLARESEANPAVLPEGVTRPLVMFGEDRFQLGVEVNWEDWTGIVSVEGAVTLHAPRTLRFQLFEVRLGGLNISLEEVRNRVKPQIDAIDSPNYRAVWVDEADRAIIEVELTDDDSHVELTEIQLAAEWLTIRGTSQPQVVPSPMSN
jgi:hypothetical protein